MDVVPLTGAVRRGVIGAIYGKRLVRGYGTYDDGQQILRFAFRRFANKSRCVRPNDIEIPQRYAVKPTICAAGITENNFVHVFGPAIGRLWVTRRFFGNYGRRGCAVYGGT